MHNTTCVTHIDITQPWMCVSTCVFENTCKHVLHVVLHVVLFCCARAEGWRVICARNACDLCPSALVCIEVHLASFSAKSFAFIHGCILQVMHLIAYYSIYGTFWNVHFNACKDIFAFKVHLGKCIYGAFGVCIFIAFVCI